MRGSGRLYEGVAAIFQHRRRTDIYHSALIVHLEGHDHIIEMAPVWVTDDEDRGVVSEGAVGFSSWGKMRIFRYEIRCWRDGIIPDVATAVDSPCRVSASRGRAQHVLDLVPMFPTATWGRDELHTGDMWNSNSLTSWLLARSGHDMSVMRPPHCGRAPGWAAGLAVAGPVQRQSGSPD